VSSPSITCPTCSLQCKDFQCACDRHQRQKPPWSISLWQALDAAHDRLVPSPDQDPTSWARMYVLARTALEMIDDNTAEALDVNVRISEILEAEGDSPYAILKEVERLVVSARDATSVAGSADEASLTNRICFQCG